LLRAAGALAGIYGNSAAEAVYPIAKNDSAGQALDGSKHDYTITFTAGQFPPVNAFWSVTMYDGKTQLLIENPINRYLINSPMMPGMKKGQDGSLTLYIQKDAPSADKKCSQHQTARFIWLCGCTGQRKLRHPFFLRATERGNLQQLKLRGNHS